MRPARSKLHIRLRNVTSGVIGHRKRRPHDGRNRARMRSFGVNRYRYLAVIPLLIAAILLAAWARQPDQITERYRPVKRSIANPLMGWAAPATMEPGSASYTHKLVHATVTWRELEPDEGEFDFESFEQVNHFAQWRALGMKVVLRFVMDAPSDQAHTDIPDWLIKRMDENPGEPYDCWVGRGYSPNYNKLILQLKHQDVIAKLGERYNDDPFIAYVEMGSLGHNGEWWTASDVGVPELPPFSEISKYISAYSSAFPGTKLMSVYPYTSAKQIRSGLYNPFIGDVDQCWNWIDLASYGGYEQQIGTDIRGLGEFYRDAPVGAQIARSVSMESLLGGEQERLLEQIRESHVSYVSGISDVELSENALSGMQLAQEQMGYRLWVRSASWPKHARMGQNMRLSLTVRNSGVAPISQHWPLQLSLIHEGKQVFKQELRIDTRTLMPGETRLEAALEVPLWLPAGTYQIGIAILDPSTGEPAVELAMVSIKHGLVSILGEVDLI